MASKIHLGLLLFCSLVISSHSIVNTIRFARKKRGLYSLDERFEADLFEYGSDYISTISVGTPAKKLSVAFNFEKSYSWIVGGSSFDEFCNARIKFVNSSSSTFKNKNRQVNITYIDGKYVKDDIVSDTMTIGTLNIKSQDFIYVSNVRNIDSESSYDGFVGLAQTADSKASDLLTPLENLVKQKSIVNSTVHSLLF